ncbi:MAG: hypothetical protein WCI79_02515 [Candidatus Saccharibacteria bacterium]
MSKFYKHYDSSENYIGYSNVEEPSAGVCFDFTNCPPVDSDSAGQYWLWCLILDVISFIVCLAISGSGSPYWSTGMLWFGSSLVSMLVLLFLIIWDVIYLTRPVKTGKKWWMDAIFAVVILSFYLAVHIIIIVVAF